MNIDGLANTVNAWRPVPAVALTALLVCCYVLFFCSFIVDVPSADDFLALLPFLVDWQQPHTFGERLEILFSQYFSHRIALTRLIALATTWTFGYLNFAFLQVLNLAAWVVLTLGLAQIARMRFAKISWTVLVPMLLLHPVGQSNITVATNGLSNITVLLLALAAGFCSRHPSRLAFPLSCLLGVCGSFTSANGILILPLLLASYLLQRQSFRSITVLVLACSAISLYFLGYSREISYSPAPSFFTGAADAILWEITRNLLAMLGAPLGFGRLPFDAVLAIGAGLVAAVFFLVWQHRERLLLSPDGMFLCFLFGSVLIAAIGRVGWGPEYVMQQDRYSPYGLLMLASLWSFWAREKTQIRWYLFVPALLFGAILCVSGYARMYATVLGHYRWNQAVALNEPLGGTFASGIYGGNALQQRRAISAGVIRLPKRFSDAPSVEFLQSLNGRPSNTAAEPAAFSTALRAPGYTRIQPDRERSLTWVPFALLIWPEGRVVLPAVSERTTFYEMLRSGRLVNRNKVGFAYPSESPPVGPADLYGIAPVENGGWKIAWHSVLQQH